MAPTAYGTPQRTATGFDARRLQVLLAVLERRAGLRLSTSDVFVNVAGGVRLEEPSADLGVAIAIASSLADVPTDSGTVALGEIGLGGSIVFDENKTIYTETSYRKALNGTESDGLHITAGFRMQF